MMNRLDVNFYPGWTRKALTFSIDDGNLDMDRKFLSIIKPAGIVGTFNLCTPLRKNFSAEDYRKMYRGFEITNHCHRHPMAFGKHRQPTVSDAPFDEATADPTLIYRTDDAGIYRIHARNWNYYIAEDDKYMELVAQCNRELESVFGQGTIRDFVWPFGNQQNPNIWNRLVDMGFRSIRATGNVSNTTGFALPADRMNWSYNADHMSLLADAKLYEECPDDGALKFFAFGVHSIDFENNAKWDDLKQFCNRYGNRPEDFWYASVGDIFDYEDAIGALIYTDSEVRNDSDTDLFVKLDGVRHRLCAHSALLLKETV